MRNKQRLSRPQLWWFLGWFYEGLFALVPHRELVASIARGLKAHERVLDAGCGTGRLARQSQAEIVGADFSATMLRWAKKRGQSVIQGDLQNLPMADEQFDVVVSLNVLYAVSDPGSVLRELVRVTRVGGEVRIATPITSELLPLVREHFQRATWLDHVKFIVNLPRLLGWMAVLTIRGLITKSEFSFYSEDELMTMFNAAGLRVISCEPCYAEIDRLVVAIKEESC